MVIESQVLGHFRGIQDSGIRVALGIRVPGIKALGNRVAGTRALGIRVSAIRVLCIQVFGIRVAGIHVPGLRWHSEFEFGVTDFRRLKPTQVGPKPVKIQTGSEPNFQINTISSSGRQVETVGKVYMVVGGAPNVTTNHCEDVAKVALRFGHTIKQMMRHLGDTIHIKTGDNRNFFYSYI